MHRKGVCYDVGVVMGMNWRPSFDPEVVGRELEIIHRDLHCNAVRIVGHSLRRLRFATEVALREGLEVWVFPQLWNRTASETSPYLARAAAVVEPLRREWPDQVVFGVGSEITLFGRGIVPGRSLVARMNNPNLIPLVKGGKHNGPLNDFLARMVTSVRKNFRGKLSYASLVWESVNWDPFDFVGVDHYWSPKIGDRYLDLLRPSFGHGKPVVITEFGHDTMVKGPLSEGFLSSAGLNPSVIDVRSQFLHQLPLVGRLVRPRLVGAHVRDEGLQARRLAEQLKILDAAGVEGTFVSQFLSQISPYDPDPRFDLDMASSSLVRYLERGKGRIYPDLPWEPKESFSTVAAYYRDH